MDERMRRHLAECMAEEDAVRSAFLDRVRALTPSEWGRLDAAGAALVGDSLGARLERLSIRAEMVTVGVSQLSAALWEMLRDDPLDLIGMARGDWRAHDLTRDPDYQALVRDRRNPFEDLKALAERQPGGPRAGYRALWYALFALTGRRFLPPHARERLYAYAESVIPYASLE